MKKFVSAIAALAVVGAMAVPAMAATNEEVIAAVKGAGANASQVTATETYLSTVKLSESTLDTVVANVNAGKAAGRDYAKVEALANSTVAVVNADPAAKDHQLSLNTTRIGDVVTVAITSNIATAGADINTKTGEVGAVNSLNGTQNGGNVPGAAAGSSNKVVKATGANMNLTAAISAALAMVATMGTAVVYGVKKGLLAK